MARACLIGWVVLLLSSPRGALADGLRNVDRATSGGRHASSSSGSQSTSRSSSGGTHGSSWSSSDDGSTLPYDEERCHYDPDYCGPGRSLGFYFVAVTFAAPWGIPGLFLDDATLQRYAPYPFADGPGLLRPLLDDGRNTARKVAIALDAESGYMLQGVVPSGLALRVLLPYRVELDARFSGLTDVRERPADVASAGTAHLTYRFAQGRRYDFRTGLGLRTFQLDDLRLGFDILYGVDVYIGPCVVWRVELHMGSAGDAFVGQARSTLGVMVSRFEVYAGYDHTAYLSATYDAALGGPIAGLRAWF